MKKIRLLSLVLATVLVCLCLSTCAKHPDKAHEPLTIITGCKDYTEFEKEFKKVYPEVQLRFISYSGYNTTSYLNRLLEEGAIPDIYTLTVLPDEELQKKYLIDLSGYDFSARYAVSRLSECSVEGAVYMLPSNYAVLGIYYNKTLFEKYGWQVPTSFAEMEALVPKIREAGVEVATTELEPIGCAFQYLFNLGDTVFLRTPEGLDWIEQFFNGEVTADAAWESTVAYVQKWIDLGLINGDWYGKTSREAEAHFAEGNTAFFITGEAFRFSQNEDGSGDRYGLMPWLSEDGSNNRYITHTSCYYGLNANLGRTNNKQKLEDALKFMSFISTEKGQQLLPGSSRQMLLPLTGTEMAQDENYRDIIDMLNAGYGAPLTYRGWENLIVPIGKACMEWYAGRSTGDQTIAVMNHTMQNLLQDETGALAYLPRDLTQEETARLVGEAFAAAVGADCALISLGGYHEGKENEFGVNGRLFDGVVDDVTISTINPLGWVDTIRTFTLTGKEIRQLAKEGFDRHHDGNPFPYVLTVAPDTKLNNEKQYTVVICGCTDEVRARGKEQNTGVSGMDALHDYFENSQKE